MVEVGDRLRYVCGFTFLFVLLPCMGGSICETITEVRAAGVNSTLSLHCKSCRSEAQWDRVHSNGTQQQVHSEDDGDLVLHVDGLGYGGRVYSCHCESGMRRECHLILVKPLVRITFSPASLMREGDNLTVECSAEGYPPPRTTDFTLHQPHSELSQTMPLDSTGLGATVQAVIPETQFQKHDGVFTCVVNVNLTQYDPTWPIVKHHENLQGSAKSQLHIYGMKNISVLTSVTQISGKATVSSASVECIAKLSQGLEMKWVKGEKDTPIDPKKTPLQYAMFPGVELDSSGSMLYAMSIRWFDANDFGRFGCAVYSEGKVLDILYTWINKIDQNESSCHCPCIDTRRESDDEHSDAEGCVVPLAILGTFLAVVILVVVISILLFIFCKRRHRLGKQCVANPKSDTSTRRKESQTEGRYSELPPVNRDDSQNNGDTSCGQVQQPEPAAEQSSGEPVPSCDDEFSNNSLTYRQLTTSSPRPPTLRSQSVDSQGTKRQVSFLRSISRHSNNPAWEPEREPLTSMNAHGGAAHSDEQHSDSDI